MSWTKRWRKRLRALVQKETVASELDEELAFHLEMEMQKNLRAGMRAEEARRQARLAFGGVEKFKEEVHDARVLGWVSGMSLDVKLGLRMLVKYPGLTLVGMLGMAVAIAIGAGFFVLTHAYLIPPLPLEEGERVIAIEMRDAAASESERRILRDFATWREELTSVQQLTAFRTMRRNLIVPEGPAEPVRVAEMTAAGFRMPRVPPLLGRYLVEEDEQPGAPAVVVIGYEVWQGRFAGDPDILGRQLRLGNALHTVVGVMPDGFAFPVNYRFWVPLRADPAAYGRREGPEIDVIGRLAPGATLDRAQAELTAIGQRTAAASPETHTHLRPRIVPYTGLFGPVEVSSRWPLYVAQLVVSLLLVVVAVNVAALVYARTATRRGEIAVRSALGASRRRIVVQLFMEALVLSAAAAVVGLLLAAVVLRQLHAVLVAAAAPHGLPFWMASGLPWSTMLYVLGLAVLGAVIIGVVPALRATGRQIQSSLRELGGGTGMQLGRSWTVLIVAQVAFAVAVLPAAVGSVAEFVRHGFAEPGFAAEQFLAAELEMDQESPPSAEAAAYEREFAARYGDRLTMLMERLQADPGVSAVTFAADVPGQEWAASIELEGDAAAASAARFRVRVSRVDPGFFDAFEVPILAGRGFHPADAGDGATAVIVNHGFVQQVLGGGSALGRRVRYAGSTGDAAPESGEQERWHEIVGVVSDFPGARMTGSINARLYHPLAAGEIYPVQLAVRVQGTTPAAFAPRLREITTALDPTLRPHEVLPLDEFYSQGERSLMRVGAWAITLVILSVLLLSAAGIYALMSFTVTRRRREIGIRAALGADPRRILASIFARAIAQLTIGVVVGGVLGGVLSLASGLTTAGATVVLLAVATIMLIVGSLAALGPARRGLRIQPVEALRAE